MPVNQSIPDTIVSVLNQTKDKRPTEAIIHGIDGNHVDIRLEGSVTILRHVEVMGNIDTVAVGDTVQISWRASGRPVIMLMSSGVANTTSTIIPDNTTIENSSFGLRVKKGGISREHLSFAIPDELGAPDSLASAGWTIDPVTGAISGRDIRILPSGEITLGTGENVIKLSAYGTPDNPASPEDDSEYRLWVGNISPHAAGFSVTKSGSLIARQGFVGGWAIKDDELVSDTENAILHSGARPYIGLGAREFGDDGFWAGKDTDYIYKMSVGLSGGPSLTYDGTDLALQDIDLKMYNGTQMTLWIEDDGDFSIGSDIDTISGTSMKIFSNAQSWGAEAFGAGDILIGDHDGAHMLWDQSLGQLQFRDGATTGLPVEVYVDTDGTLRAGGGNVVLDSSGIYSSNYLADVSGFNIDTNGDAEFNRITARGRVKTAVFEVGEVVATGGDFIVLDADELAVTMTALDSAALTIDGNTTFAVGDFLRIKEDTDDEWLEVTNIASAPTYAVTRDKAASYTADNNPTWDRGAAVVNYGPSGSGGLRFVSGPTPYLSVFTHSGVPWTTIEDHVRLEENISCFGQDLSAAGSTALAIFHAGQTYNSETVYQGDLLIGDNTASKANLFWDRSAGIINFRSGTDIFGSISATGVLRLGRVATGYENIKITGTGITFYDNTTVRGTLTGAEWVLGNATYEHIVINNSTLKMYDGGNEYASFGATTTVGNTAAEHVLISPAGISMMMDNTIVRGQWQTDGDIFIGSNIAVPATTYLSIFSTAQTYNTEVVAAGDMLIGDNTALKANIFWDASAATLNLRAGQNTEVYIVATDVYANPGKVGIGGMPTDGRLHVIGGSAGSVTAYASANELVIEKDGITGLSILTPDSSTGFFAFGHPGNNMYNGISAYGPAHASYAGQMALWAAGSPRVRINATYTEFVGNITVSGTVDGVDVAALKTDVDGFPDQLKNLVTAEIQQLEAIGAATINAAQWLLFGAADQGISTTDTVSFANITSTGTLNVTGITSLENPIKIKEAAAAVAQTAAYGQFWVKNAAPNQPWFDNDAGLSYRIGGNFLPFSRYTGTIPLSSATEDPYIVTIGRNLTVRNWHQTFFVNGTNDAANCWYIYLQYGTAGTAISSFSTESYGASTWAVRSHLAIDSARTSADRWLRVRCIKNGNPGTLYIAGPMVYVYLTT